MAFFLTRGVRGAFCAGEVRRIASGRGYLAEPGRQSIFLPAEQVDWRMTQLKFFSPQGFKAVMKQTYSREKKIV